jgi:hypothetical protein
MLRLQLTRDQALDIARIVEQFDNSNRAGVFAEVRTLWAEGDQVYGFRQVIEEQPPCERVEYEYRVRVEHGAPHRHIEVLSRKPVARKRDEYEAAVREIAQNGKPSTEVMNALTPDEKNRLVIEYSAFPNGWQQGKAARELGQ